MLAAIKACTVCPFIISVRDGRTTPLHRREGQKLYLPSCDAIPPRTLSCLVAAGGVVLFEPTLHRHQD